MSKHGTIRRYSLEIEIIRKSKLPSFAKIKEHLIKHSFEISDRTLQRDIEQIRNEFGIEIEFNREENGYFINEERSINLESFLRFLEIVNTAVLLTESLSESKNSLQYISFDIGGELKGIENLKPILKAIKNNRFITFDHNNFHTNKTRKHLFKPYLLKEYLKRWYIIGTFGGSEDFRTFGIERIENLKVKAETFKPNVQLNPLEIFKQTIGLVYSENKAQIIVLSFTPTQGKYIKTLPLHSSQKIITDNEIEYRVSIEVIPNYELKQLILRHGDTVKVIQPEWFVDEIKENLKNALDRY